MSCKENTLGGSLSGVALPYMLFSIAGRVVIDAFGIDMTFNRIPGRTHRTWHLVVWYGNKVFDSNINHLLLDK